MNGRVFHSSSCPDNDFPIGWYIGEMHGRSIGPYATQQDAARAVSRGDWIIPARDNARDPYYSKFYNA